jgi:hypothetical protein
MRQIFETKNQSKGEVHRVEMKKDPVLGVIVDCQLAPKQA